MFFLNESEFWKFVPVIVHTPRCRQFHDMVKFCKAEAKTVESFHINYMPISFMGSAIAIPISSQAYKSLVCIRSFIRRSWTENLYITGFILKLLKGKATFFHVTDIFGNRADFTGSVKEALNS